MYGRMGIGNYLIPSKIDFLRLKVGPLLRLASEVDVPAETFIHKIERLKLAMRINKDPQASVQTILEDVALLPEFVVSDPTVKSVLSHCTPERLPAATPSELNDVRDKLAPHMKNKKRQNSFLSLDLADMIDLSGYIMLTKSGEQVYVKEYRRRVEERILHIVENHPALIAIARGEPVDEEQLIALERILQQDLAGGILEATQENLRRAYGIHIDSFLDLLRHVLDMEAIPGYEQVVAEQFQVYITQHSFNADQIRFMRAVQSVFLRKRQLALADLYQEPLTNFGEDAVDRWFEPKQVEEMLAFVNKLAI